MRGQLNFQGKTKLEVTLERIKAFEPPEGYYVAFSGGKDSQCIYELCKMAGVKFDAHYHVTSVDPPELVQFIRDYYPDVKREVPHDKDGKPITMWSLIEKNTMPPTRIARYCCAKLKESGGEGRLTMTGVRWAESVNRKKNQGGITIMSKANSTVREIEEYGAEFTKTDRGGLIMNLDNDNNRRSVEICYRTRKTIINPIIDWDDSDVWEFLNEVAKVPHCKLYDEGFKRIGCIGCPIGMARNMIKQFKRYPKYKAAYIKSMQKMCDNHPGEIKVAPHGKGEEVFNWWIGGIK